MHRPNLGARRLIPAVIALAIAAAALTPTAAAAASFSTGPGRSWSIAAHAPGGGNPVPGGPLEVVVTLTWDSAMHDYVGAGCSLVGSTGDPRVPSMYFMSYSASPSSSLFPSCGTTHNLSGDFLTATWTTSITAPSSAGAYSVKAYSRGSTYFSSSFNFSYSDPYSYTVASAPTTTTTTTTAAPTTTTTTAAPTTTTTTAAPTTTTTTTAAPTTTTTTTAAPTTTTTTTAAPTTTTTTTAAPTTTTAAPTGRRVSLSTETPTPGSSMVVSGSGFTPGSDVEVWLYSDPILLATVIADENGSFEVTVVIPEDVTGSHTVQVVDMSDPDAVVSPGAAVGVSVSPPLAVTGSSLVGLVWSATLLVALGVLLRVAGSANFSPKRRIEPRS